MISADFGWVVKKLLPLLMDLWEAWSIQLLVLTSLVFQLTLAIFGSRRRFPAGLVTRFLVWASYLLSAYVATIALGKLIVIRINDPKKPDYDTELKALPAPLLLVLLGSLDAIIACTVEDNRLSVRQALNFILTVGFVVWILIRCWDKSLAATLYFPTFVARIIKYGETIWALKLVFGDSSRITIKEIGEEEGLQGIFEKLTNNTSIQPTSGDSHVAINGLCLTREEEMDRLFRNLPKLYGIFLKAYHWFDCSKPHLVSWLYRPLFISRDWMDLDKDTALAFLTTDIELGFMYDILYTKSPVLYMGPGIVLRFISCLSSLSILSGFSWIFGDSFLVDLYVTHTYVVLIGVAIMETYQILHLRFSDRVIASMIKHCGNSLISTFLPYITRRSIRRKRRWSGQMGQFNLLDYRLHEKRPKAAVRVLKISGKDNKFKIYWDSESKRIPMCHGSQPDTFS